MNKLKHGNKNKQVICGPYGLGKTVLIQHKAYELASSGEEVMIIVPHHLVPLYEEFFQEQKMQNFIHLKSF